jgi:predicted metal-dependent phosphotriesterase family hydrolase
VFVRTVQGNRDPDILGYTYCHDHLFVYKTDGVLIPERMILDNYENVKIDTATFKEKGGGAIVDVQPFGAGRHPQNLVKLSRETGVHIISATGFHKSLFYNDSFWAYNAPEKEISDLFISEIEQGMYEYEFDDPFYRRSNIRAGIIKIATENDGVTGYYKKMFNAAALAHTVTGAPVITHTELSSFGLEQARYLIDKGVRPESIIVSHMDRKIDAQKNIELARLGVFLEYDTIARFKYHSDKDEVSLIKTMIDQGFEKQILLGMDSTRERYRAYGGSPGLEYIITGFIPMLQEAGIEDGLIETIMVNNPKNALAFKK